MTKYIFTISHHAAKRMKQRKVDHPSNCILTVCSRELKRRIKSKCRFSHRQSGIAYFMSKKEESLDVSIYICSIEGKGFYNVLTVFKMKV